MFLTLRCRWLVLASRSRDRKGYTTVALNLVDLDEITRGHMLAELEQGTLYMGKDLSDEGEERYPGLLREAIESGDDSLLQERLSEAGVFNAMGLRQGKPVKVPSNAPQRLAEGEFNRFYLRGLCLRAMEEGFDSVIVYRARKSSSPRAESEALVGSSLNAEALLGDLRRNPGVDTALGLPPGPNSGLSARLPSS
jgi:hypothetical protein